MAAMVVVVTGAGIATAESAGQVLTFTPEVYRDTHLLPAYERAKNFRITDAKLCDVVSRRTLTIHRAHDDPRGSHRDIVVREQVVQVSVAYDAEPTLAEHPADDVLCFNVPLSSLDEASLAEIRAGRGSAIAARLFAVNAREVEHQRQVVDREASAFRDTDDMYGPERPIYRYKSVPVKMIAVSLDRRDSETPQ
jgi:hypothetical protein